MNAEIEYAANTFGFPNPEYDTMGVSYLQKQLNIVNDEISDIQKKIQNKQAEIEAIKAGTNLSDLDRAAREEYVRTGSSAPMQSLENSRLSREMTAKTQADIDEETLDDTIKQISNVEADLVLKYHNGEALTDAERSEFLKSYAEYERLAKKLKKLNGTQYNDSGAAKDTTANNGIDDTFEVMKEKVGGTTDVLTDKEKSGTRIKPDEIATTVEFVEQWPNYKTTTDKEDARKALAGQYGTSAKFKDGIYSLDLDQKNVIANKDKLEEAGFNVYSFSKANENANVKAAENLKQGAINAAYDAWDQEAPYSDTNFKIYERDMQVALEKYNRGKKPPINWDSIKEAVKAKIRSNKGKI